MRSHHYQLTPGGVLRGIWPTLLVLGALVGLLKAGARFGWLPAPRPGADPNTVVLAHQARAVRSPLGVEVVLLGDSTCMMGVDAPALSRCLPGHPQVVNLGLISWLSFNTYVEALSDFAAANPGRVRTAVLLVSPRKLNLEWDESHEAVWRELCQNAQERSCRQISSAPAGDWAGTWPLRQNLLSHLLAIPLRGQGEGRTYFGFSSEVDAYMAAHQGSMLDFGTVTTPQRPVQLYWGLAKGLEAASRAFRTRIPPGVKLFIGFTPMPEGHISPAQRRERSEMLQQWSRWMNADGVLTNLPATLPNVFFANNSHPTEAGQKQFTRRLGRELAAALGALPSNGSGPVQAVQSRAQLPKADKL